MSTSEMAQVAGQIIIDSRFRSLFFTEVENALEGYDLTAREIDLLRAMANCSVIKTGVSVAGYRYRQIEERLDEGE